jgi:hypothetical protein
MRFRSASKALDRGPSTAGSPYRLCDCVNQAIDLAVQLTELLLQSLPFRVRRSRKLLSFFENADDHPLAVDVGASTCSVGFHNRDWLNWSLSNCVLFRMFLVLDAVGLLVHLQEHQYESRAGSDFAGAAFLCFDGIIGQHP